MIYYKPVLMIFEFYIKELRFKFHQAKFTLYQFGYDFLFYFGLKAFQLVWFLYIVGFNIYSALRVPKFQKMASDE